jgi:hypothetical protein
MDAARTRVMHHIYNTLFTDDPINIFMLNLTDSIVFAFAGAQSPNTLEIPRSEISDCIEEDLAQRLPKVTFLDVRSCTKIGARAL